MRTSACVHIYIYILLLSSWKRLEEKNYYESIYPERSKTIWIGIQFFIILLYFYRKRAQTRYTSVIESEQRLRRNRELGVNKRRFYGQVHGCPIIVLSGLC